MPIDAGDVVTFAGFVGLVLAYQQLRLGRRAQQTQLIAQLYQEFTRDERRLSFLYKLVYSEPHKWTHNRDLHDTEDERQLDGLLYYFSFIGTLTKHGDIAKRDLQWLVSELRILLENSEVQNYIIWLREEDQLPEHVSFVNAVHLYGQLVGSNGHYRKLMAAFESGSPSRPTHLESLKLRLLRWLRG